MSIDRQPLSTTSDGAAQCLREGVYRCDGRRLGPAFAAPRVAGGAHPWAPTLCASMTERGVAVHEEQVLAGLLENWTG